MEATDMGKMALFVRSVLWDLGIPQCSATVLYEDNDAATSMANAQKPKYPQDPTYCLFQNRMQQDFLTIFGLL